MPLGSGSRAHRKALLELFKRAKSELKESKDVGAIAGKLVDQILPLSKCQDFVVNKGHYFGTDYLRTEEPGLSDTDKRALIAFIKTL